MNRSKNQMFRVREVLDEAKEWNMEIEVVTTAMNALKQNSKLSIDEALAIGINEWIK